MQRILLLLLVCSCFQSCIRDKKPHEGIVESYVPIYASSIVQQTVRLSGPRPTVNAGKIYAYNNYIFQMETGAGIHVIHQANPQKLEKTGFIEISGSSEISIKDNFLYTNSLKDLLVIDISNPASPFLSRRVKDVFPLINQLFPPFTGVYFECPDPAKGVVTGWEKKEISIPNCRR